jgi:hypothetical protein
MRRGWSGRRKRSRWRRRRWWVSETQAAVGEEDQRRCRRIGGSKRPIGFLQNEMTAKFRRKSRSNPLGRAAHLSHRLSAPASSSVDSDAREVSALSSLQFPVAPSPPDRAEDRQERSPPEFARTNQPSCTPNGEERAGKQAPDLLDRLEERQASREKSSKLEW